jgi:hypothetical protein
MSMRKHGVVYRPPDGTSWYLFACACHWDTWSAIRRASHTAYWSDRDQALFNFLYREVLPWTAKASAVEDMVMDMQWEEEEYWAQQDGYIGEPFGTQVPEDDEQEQHDSEEDDSEEDVQEVYSTAELARRNSLPITPAKA